MNLNWFVFNSISTLELNLSLLGYVSLGVYAALSIFASVRGLRTFKQLTIGQWAAFVLLLIATPFVSRFLVVTAEPSGGALAVSCGLLCMLPSLAAALWLSKGPAGAVGLVTGLTLALFDTGRVTQPFEWLLMGHTLGLLLEQRYQGKVAGWLRQPLVAGLLSSLVVLLPLQSFGIFATGHQSLLGNLEQAIWQMLPALLMTASGGLLAGGLAQFALALKPEWRTISKSELQPPPWAHRLQLRILYTFVPSFILAMMLYITVGTMTAYRVATRMVLAERVNDALLAIALPPIVLMGLLTLVALPLIILLTRQVASPLETIAQAADNMAEGQLSEPLAIQGEDEIGRLGRAIEKMRVRLNERLNEQERLLSVSRGVSSSLELFRAMPSILNSALDIAHATGVRVVLQTGEGQAPQTYVSGEGAAAMSVLDHQLLDLVEQQGTVVISRLWRAAGSLDTSNLPQSVQSLVALPLRSETHFHGILWLGYDHEHDFEQSEMTFLSTLAGQAAIAVANARLFAEAAEGRRKLEAVLESTADGMIVVDNQSRILLLNPAAERFFGIKAEQSIGRKAGDVIYIQQLSNVLTDFQQPASMLELPHHGGRTLAANTSTIVGHDGAITGRVTVLRDITALKELDNIKTVFLRMVSHDLRSPLTYMRGYASMLPLSGELNTRQSEALERINGGIEHISQMTERLTYLSRLQFGEDAELEMMLVDVRDLIEEEMVRHIELAGQKEVSIDVETEEGLPLVLCDALLFGHAITNLIQNAVKYTPEKGTITIQARLEAGDSITVCVHDTGIGIREEDQEKLFSAFYRVPVREDEPPRPRGTGLGLALVKAIAEAHDGHVGVDSEYGKGSTFSITLPLRSTSDL